MTQYNRLNKKLSHSQLNKLKSAIKNETDAVIRLFPNMIGDLKTDRIENVKCIVTNYKDRFTT